MWKEVQLTRKIEVLSTHVRHSRQSVKAETVNALFRSISYNVDLY